MRDIGAEHTRYASLAWKPSVSISWIGPQAVNHNSFIPWLLDSHSFTDVFKFHAILREETSMRHEDLLIDAVAKGQVLKQVAEQVVHFTVVLVLHFAVEAVQLVELGCLVVASAHEEVIRIAYFPRKQAHDDLN